MSDHPKINPKDLCDDVLAEIAKTDKLNACPICEILLVETCSQGGKLSVNPCSSWDWNMERMACVSCNIVWSLHREITDRRIRLVATSDCYHAVALLILYKSDSVFIPWWPR